MRGIKLTGNEREMLEQVNDYIGELGGVKIRKYHNAYTGNMDLSFNAKRSGECFSTHITDREGWCEQPCFGHQKKKGFKAYKELNRVHQKAHRHYENVNHYTLTNCKAGCLFKAVVVCVRLLKTSHESYMTSHIAGQCPYCTYFFRY
jgi:hypothetical protein